MTYAREADQMGNKVIVEISLLLLDYLYHPEVTDADILLNFKVISEFSSCILCNNCNSELRKNFFQ
jgi:hypothetical protein